MSCHVYQVLVPPPVAEQGPEWTARTDPFAVGSDVAGRLPSAIEAAAQTLAEAADECEAADTDPASALNKGLEAMRASDCAGAAAFFLTAQADPALRPVASYGLGCVLSASGNAQAGLELAEALIAAGMTSPKVTALAGWSAGIVGDEVKTRRFMASTAQKCRNRADLRDLLHFAQRILLIQTFGR